MKLGKLGVLKFHPQCNRVELTHLCFSNNLLIFTHGDIHTIIGIKRLLPIFYFLSGLKLNEGKSELFAVGQSDGDLQMILEATRFKHGKLSVRYLGVPLITRKLSVNDCEPLIRKIGDRIEHWSSRFLSYAGRLQLIQAVIFSVQVYWSRNFILPKSFIRHIEQLCFAFLWHSKEQKVKSARFQWLKVV